MRLVLRYASPNPAAMPPAASDHSAFVRLRAVPREAWAWLAVLAAAALTDPTAPPFAELCPFEALGLWCPGDGLGTGVAYALDGNLRRAFAAHPFAPIAVIVLGARLVRLLRQAWRA